MKEQLIAAGRWSKVLAGAAYGYPGKRVRLDVTGQLVRYDNQIPHYSITGDVKILDRRYRDPFIMGGAIHENIISYFPQLAPLVRVHLSDLEGIPLHAEANARHWAGLSKWSDGSPMSPRTNYGRYPLETASDGLEWSPLMLANHLRVEVPEAREIREALARGVTWRQILELSKLPDRWAREAAAARALLKTVESAALV